MKKALVTLALGTFGLGVTEFVMMAILPFIAEDFGVSIAEAGHLISSYGFGRVCRRTIDGGVHAHMAIEEDCPPPHVCLFPGFCRNGSFS